MHCLSFLFQKAISYEEKDEVAPIWKSKAVNDNKETVIKSFIKVDRYSHLLSVSSLFCFFSADYHHVLQDMNLKKDNVHLVWDGTNMPSAEDWVVNDDVDMEHGPAITKSIHETTL
jgi:hypothetical protein